MEFIELKGKTFIKVEKENDEEIRFYLSEFIYYKMFHSQDCCEDVTIEDISGDLKNLCNSEILIANEVISECENPEGVKAPEFQDSFTWTFYKLATIKGYVDIRWYGESNGYYSESVDLCLINLEGINE